MDLRTGADAGRNIPRWQVLCCADRCCGECSAIVQCCFRRRRSAVVDGPGDTVCGVLGLRSLDMACNLNRAREATAASTPRLLCIEQTLVHSGPNLVAKPTQNFVGSAGKHPVQFRKAQGVFSSIYSKTLLFVLKRSSSFFIYIVGFNQFLIGLHTAIRALR